MNNHAETLQVKQVMQNYMDGSFQANIEKLKSAFHANAVMNGYLGPECVLATPAAFIDDIASAPSMASPSSVTSLTDSPKGTPGKNCLFSRHCSISAA